MAYIDTKYLFKCETCRHCIGEYKCNTYCDHGEEYSPNLSKIPTADVAPKSEGAREIIAIVDGFLYHHYNGTYSDDDLYGFFAELKKKYTEKNK